MRSRCALILLLVACLAPRQTVLAASVDPNEPNDSPSTATTLNAGNSRFGSVGSLSDRDYFTFTTATTQQVIVDVVVTYIVDLRVELLDATGIVLTSTTTAIHNYRENLKLAFVVPGGRYYVRMSAVTFTSGYDYTVRLTVPATVDEQEPNDSEIHAAPIVRSVPISSYLITSDDRDFYAVDIAAPTFLKVNLSVPSFANYNVRVWRPGPPPPDTEGPRGAGKGEELNLFAPKGRYYIEVYGYGFSQTDPYSIVFDTGWFADTAEPNNTPDTATPIELGAPVSGLIYVLGDWDVFRFELPQSSHVRTELLLPPEVGASVSLSCNDTHLSLDSSLTFPGEPNVIVTTLPAGTCYMLVAGIGNSTTEPYMLTVTAGTFTDTYEPNNDRGTALPIGPHAYQSKIYTDRDRDVYRFVVTGPGSITIDYAHPAPGYGSMRLVDAAGQSLNFMSADPNAVARLTPNLSAGIYYIELSAAANTTDLYTLTLTGSSIAEPTANCTFDVSPLTFQGTSAPFDGTVTVLASNSTCTWGAESSPAVKFTSASTGTGSGILRFSVLAHTLPETVLSTISAAGRLVRISQTPAPVLSVDPPLLRFAATRVGGSIVAATGAQSVRVTLSDPTVTWTVQPRSRWLRASVDRAAGSATLTISIVEDPTLPLSGSVISSVQVGGPGISGPNSVSVWLDLFRDGTSGVPFGALDVPAADMTGVTGSLAVSGWALDDIETMRVVISRDTVAGEPIGQRAYIGDAAFVEGARPDVAQAFATRPLSTRAGWGYMLLTNMLPNQGNGTFTLHATAYDRDGHATELGSRNITCTNQFATLPFGTIDTPRQGDVISGTQYINFGWALTPMPKTIPFNGSTFNVFIDGAPIGPVAYNNYRPDIATLFPGLNNSNGAVGFRIIDTTTLANGVHTIAWTVSDNAGGAVGIGSRYFTVQNSAALTAGVHTPVIADPVIDARHTAETVGVFVRMGFDERDTLVPAERVGEVWTVRVDPGSRLEVHFTDVAALHLASERPAGAAFDHAANVFYWQPGPAFAGHYDFVFVDAAGTTVTLRVTVAAREP